MCASKTKKRIDKGGTRQRPSKATSNISAPLTKTEVIEVFSKNGIKDLDQLAGLISSSSVDNPLADSIDAVAASWIIKVWKLDKKAEMLELPKELGGDIIRRTKGVKIKEVEIKDKGVNIKDKRRK